jgi:hypothetical protein
MTEKRSVADLFKTAGNRLRVEFEGYRQDSFHAGQMGAEVETVLRRFLQGHLPRRFEACPAILIDSENNASKQCDLAVFDAINSPTYRVSDIQRILPIDHVAAAIEVKTSLNKSQLEDAYEKIASVKSLKKTPLSDMDRAATGSTLSTISTMGIIFAFASDTSLETLADNAKELNTRFDSKLWPDLIVVLDKGIISYLIQFPNSHELKGMVMPPATDDFFIPPAYQILCVTQDGDLTLSRFFTLLLSQLTFFAHRPSSMRFEQALAGASNQALTIQGYQYDTERNRRTVSPELDGKSQDVKAELLISDHNDKPLGQLGYFSWQNGGYIVALGHVPLQPLLEMLLSVRKPMTFRMGDCEYSSVLKVTLDNFRNWPSVISQKQTNIRLALRG